jgi:hypothetical protein
MVISKFSFNIFAFTYVQIPIFLVVDYSTTFNRLLEEKQKEYFERKTILEFFVLDYLRAFNFMIQKQKVQTFN